MLYNKSVLAIFIILLFALLGPLAVMAQPVPIGDPAYHQANPFDSRPTVGSYSGVGTVQGTIDNAFDGDLSTSITFYYGATTSGYVETQAFKKPSDNALTDFAITWIDIKVSYKAASTSTNDDRYRIVAYVDPSPTPIVLQDWVTGYDAKYDRGTGNQGHRAFSNVAEPIDGVWTWSDLASLRVRFETEQVGANNFQRITLYDIWVSAYSTPYPEANSISVQPSLIMNVPVGDVFYVDLYVTNVVEMWGYQIVLEFDPGVLTAIEYFSYGPFVSALPSEIAPDYVAVAYKTYDGDPVGFTGSTPIARIYFAVNAYGASVLHLSYVGLANASGFEFTLTARDGMFHSFLSHDVAVTSVSASPTNVLPGETVEINATVMNQGTFSEAFAVTAYYDSNPISTQSPIELLPGASEDLTFVWDTSGVAIGFHQIKVEATLTTDDNPEDNVKIWSLVPEGLLIGRHDIAVTNIVRAYSNGTVVPDAVLLNVTRGEIVIINVTVLNKGDFSETFNVTALWKTTTTYGIENKTDVTLVSGASVDLTFFWNTDVTYPPWPFYFDRYGRPLNFSRGDIWVIAAPAQNVWEPHNIYSKGVPFEKGLDYDYTVDNDLTDGEVRVNRDPKYPMALFYVHSTPFTNQPVDFDGTHSYTLPGTTITSYRWDFGDGNVTEGNYPTIVHAYAAQGNYTATLIVTNNLGLSSILGSFFDHETMRVYDRNVKVVRIAVSQTLALVGQSIEINVTIKNEGHWVEDPNEIPYSTQQLSVYYDDVLIGSVIPPWLGTSRIPPNSRTVEFIWDTSGTISGTYTIKAVLDVLPYENNTADNTLVDGVITLVSWDYEFTDTARGTTLKIDLNNKFFQFSTPTKDYGIKQDPNMNIQDNKVTIRFEDAELRLRSMIIDTKKTSCSARAEDLQTGETFWLVQRPSKWTVGDVNYDGKIDVLDAGTVSAHWGMPTGPLGYDPTADLNSDGVIDLLDAAIVSAHWGETTS